MAALSPAVVLGKASMEHMSVASQSANAALPDIQVPEDGSCKPEKKAKLTSTDLVLRLRDLPTNSRALHAVGNEMDRLLRRPKAQVLGVTSSSSQLLSKSVVGNKHQLATTNVPDTVGAAFFKSLHNRCQRTASTSDTSLALKSTITTSLPPIVTRSPPDQENCDTVAEGTAGQKAVMQDTDIITAVDSDNSSSTAGSQRPLSSKSLSSLSESYNIAVRPPSVPKNSCRPNLNLVLGYLQKNIYDNTAPENDDFLTVLTQRRRKLGFIVDLPDHKPGFRVTLAKLFDEVDSCVEKQKAKGLEVDQDDGSFYYALLRDRANPRAYYNPYDLQVVSANEARVAPVYYCATAVGITRVEHRGRSLSPYLDRIRALEWLWERKLFCMICHLRVFTQFRMWKAFRVWKENVRCVKNTANEVMLTRMLFTTHDVLRRCLLHVRLLCETASSSRDGVGVGSSAISLIVIDPNATLKLEQFMDNQQNQLIKVRSQLESLREKIIEAVLDACTTAAEMEGIPAGILTEGTQLTAESLMAAAVSGRLPAKPTYAQVVQWCQVLKRLSCFLRSVDFLVLDLLHRLVRTALQTLLQFVKESFRTGIQLEKQEASSVPSKSKAIVSVHLVLQSCVDIQADKLEKSTAVEAENRDKEESEDACEISSEDQEFQQMSLILSPTAEQLTSCFRDIETDLQTTVGTVKSLFCESRLAAFYVPLKSTILNAQPQDQMAILEVEAAAAADDGDGGNDDELDDIDSSVAGGHQCQWPDTNVLFELDPAYCKSRNKLLLCVDDSIDMVVNYSHEFEKYVSMVNRASRLDVEESMKRSPWSTETFRKLLTLHTSNVNQISAMPVKKRLGIIQVLSDTFQRSCLPAPRGVLRSINMQLPIIAGLRCKQLGNVVKESSLKLEQHSTTIEEFVEHLLFVGKISCDITALELEYHAVTRLYTIARDFEIFVQPEDLALYQLLSHSFKHLETALLFAEAKKDDDIRRFKKDLYIFVNDVRKKLCELKNNVADVAFLSADSQPSVVLQRLGWLTDTVKKLSNRAQKYAVYQQRFGKSTATTSRRQKLIDSRQSEKDESGWSLELSMELSEVERDLTLRRMLWESHLEWDKLSSEWHRTPFEEISVENLQLTVQRFIQTIYLLEKGLPNNSVVPGIKRRMQSFQSVLPIFISLRNPSLKDRHWHQIEATVEKSIVGVSGVTLGDLLDTRITKHRDKIQEISAMASNEAMLERMLMKIADVWMTTDFRLIPHRTGTVLVIAGADELQSLLEENQMTLGTIRGSRYSTPFKAAVSEWDHKLTLFAKTLDIWLICQRNWLYLEQIFSTPDIQRQLQAESNTFQQVDATWRDIMKRTADRPNALKAATAPGIQEMLFTANSQLDKIQKSLDDYLETKRLVFPRFYFLSNDELLDIMAQSKNHDSIQPHLSKCFSGIKSLDIYIPPRQPPTVRTMISHEGEAVQMPKNVRARGAVEQWLDGIEAGMFETIRKHMKAGLQSWSEEKLNEWVLNNPGQVALAVAQIMFNKDVVECLNVPDLTNATMPSAHDSTASHVSASDANQVVGAATERSKSSARSEPMKLPGCNTLPALLAKFESLLSSLMLLISKTLATHHRLSVNALLTIYVHCRDVISMLISDDVTSLTDFQWTRQLRYMWNDAANQCCVSQCNANFTYGYEYLGCCQRLVITPLTDRCNLTLTTALKLNLGGSPAGPAGTGKTETIKDLARSMGKHCVVFNCSEGLDFKMLGRFFSGLSQSGNWGCFDEFNRIDAEVLSVVAQQIHTIKSAKDQLATRFIFEGRDIKLNATCGIFITMNPNYTGRVELPDNLTSLFRPVAMIIPDYALIAEIILFSEGFSSAKSLARKLVSLYDLASRQLSHQHHYDFGLRAIKSVLTMAGQKKRTLQTSEERLLASSEDETLILFHALRDANIPKFLSQDVLIFYRIVTDLFPGLSPIPPQLGGLQQAIDMSLSDLGLQHWPSQVEKVCQLYSQLSVRHGVMLVGPTGGGKTAIQNIMQRTLVHLPTVDMENSVCGNMERNRLNSVVSNRQRKGQVETFVINPKCVTLGELYGETDPTTFEWTDGIIARAARKFARVNSVGSVPADLAVGGGGQDFDKQSLSDIAEDVISTVVDSSASDWQWIVLDGPVDPLWIENLNTALDDTKVLCLANGERIALTPTMRLLFEVDDLTFASPATISRCGMVYLDPANLGWQPYVKTWLSHLPAELPALGREHLESLFDQTIDRGFTFLSRHSAMSMMPAPEHCVIHTLCSLLMAYLNFMVSHGGFGNTDVDTDDAVKDEALIDYDRKASIIDRKNSTFDFLRKQSGVDSKEYFLQRHPTMLMALLGKLYAFAYIWAFGGNFKRDDYNSDDLPYRSDVIDLDVESGFDSFVHDVFDLPEPYGVRLPLSNKSVHSYFVDLDTGNFVRWEILIPTTESLINQDTSQFVGESLEMAAAASLGKMATKDYLSGDVIATVDTVRFSFLSALLLTSRQPVLVIGESGVGKTMLLKHMLRRLEQPDGCSLTDSNSLIGSILNYTSKNQALLLGISALANFTQLAEEGVSSDDELLQGVTSLISRHSSDLLVSSIQFGAQTSVTRVKVALMSRLLKRGRDRFGPPKGKQVVLFIDDLNLPSPGVYGAQPPLEFLRQFLDLNGFYSTSKLSWMNVSDVTVLSACGSIGGGRTAINPRLLKHFCLLAVPHPSMQSLQHIFQTHLGRFLKTGEFVADVRDCCASLVAAGVAVYRQMCSTLRPTPSKIHYTFNIRDLSQIIGGIMQVDNTVILTSKDCAQLFAHEATRVFCDRLIDETDSDTFYRILSGILHDFFKVRWTADELSHKPTLFADFSSSSTLSGVRLYRPVNDLIQLQKHLEELYVMKNIGSSQVQRMVFFRVAVEHVLRVVRILRQTAGHGLLIGLDGTGKSASAKLAAYIAGCQLCQLSLTRGYSLQDFRTDLKRICLSTGVKGIPTVLLLTDTCLLKESFLEDINCVLNSGEIPDLFDREEFDGITMDLKSAIAEAQISETRSAIYQFFFQRVKRNLHIMLSFSPAGTKFRQRCRANPSLISCCTIDWYHNWDANAMLSVAEVYLHDLEFSSVVENIEENLRLRHAVAQVCVQIHSSVIDVTQRYWDELQRKNYVTPSSYVEFISLYAKLFASKHLQILTNKEHLVCSLSRLSETKELVGTMQSELIALGPEIENKAKDTEVLLQQLLKDQEAVEQVRQIVQQEENVMKQETQVVEDYAKECERDLQSVLPVLEAAIESLDALDKSDIAEIRVYTHPPDTVTMVISAVCILLQESASTWAIARQVMSDQQFLKRLVDIDKDAIPEKVFLKLKRYTSHPDFKPDKMGAVSKACKSMCLWVLAVEHYHNVYKMAKPKQKRVEDATAALLLAQENLVEKQSSLHKIEEHLKMLQGRYQDSVNERETLKQRKELTAVRLQRAAVLIEALSTEKERWSQLVDESDAKLSSLVGDMLMSAGIIAYSGIFTNKYRRQLVISCLSHCRRASLPLSTDFRIANSLTTPNQVLRWHNEGLPQDIQSTENAVIIQNSQKWPLIIDPQAQASAWIRQMEGSRLKVVQASDPNCMRVIERGIRIGEPVLLQGVTETLELMLRPLLMHEIHERAGQQTIIFGDVEIEYNSNFRLYLATSLQNPHFLPAVCNIVTIINFVITFDGLQEQLLSTVVRQECPMLESDRSHVLTSLANDLQMLRDLEDKTLGLLQKSEDHLLDRQDLIDSLQKSQSMSHEIQKRVLQSEEAERKLNRTRKKYLPVATRGAIIYFVLSDLSNIDVMYQFSLNWFQSVFTAAIKSCSISRTGFTDQQDFVSQISSDSEDDNLNIHLQVMIDRVMSAVHRLVLVGLFDRHCHMFSFLLATSIMRAETENGTSDSIKTIGSIAEQEWTVFLQGSAMASRAGSNSAHANKPDWISEVAWQQCCHLESVLKCFRGLAASVATNSVQWDALMAADDPYIFISSAFFAKDAGGASVFGWNCLTPFQRLILIKIIRPVTLLSSVNSFVAELLGPQFITVDHTVDSLQTVYSESSAKTPIIFILSPGSNPADQLMRLAKERRGSTLHLDMISLGRGQGAKAEELISKAQVLKGRWIYLQNCHLAASWMPRLQTIVDNFSKQGSDMDTNFRLFLSSKPDPCFPVSVLQSGLKITVETLSVIKTNLRRSFGTGGIVTAKLHDEDCPAGKQQVWKTLLFGLCLFNAAIHERRKYSRLGWNLSYEFIDADLEVSLLELKMVLTEQKDLAWSALWYLVGDVIYGGRVSDEWDRRCLLGVLHKFVNADTLQPEFTFNEKFGKPLPVDPSHSEMCDYVDQLPSCDLPDLFGMDTNAQLTSLESQSQQIIDDILMGQSRLNMSLSNRGKSSDALVLNVIAEMKRNVLESIENDDATRSGSGQVALSPITLSDIVAITSGSGCEFIQSLTESESHKKLGLNVEYIVEGIKQIGQSALFTVLCHEVQCYDQLLSIVHRNLATLELAVTGEVVMSDELENAYNSLLNNVLPSKWRDYSYQTCKSLSAWIKDLIARVHFIRQWLDQVLLVIRNLLRPTVTPRAAVKDGGVSSHFKDPHPLTYWLSAFFFPRGFLTAVLQRHARTYGISIDSLHFDFHVYSEGASVDTKTINKDFASAAGNTMEGVVIYGLYLDGAMWDSTRHLLCDSQRGHRYSLLPPIHFIPSVTKTDLASCSKVTDSEIDATNSGESLTQDLCTYECPLYQTTLRSSDILLTGQSTSFVTSVHLNCGLHSPDLWIMRGVALLCQLDD